MIEPFPRIPVNSRVAREIREILGLPHYRWTPIRIHIGEDGATCEMSLLLTADELRALTELSISEATEGDMGD